MKFALYDFNYTSLPAETIDLVGEVVLEYKGQLDAVNKISYHKDLGLRIVWDLSLVVVAQRDMEETVRELKELLEIYSNMAFKIPIPSPNFVKLMPPGHVFFSREYAARTYQEAMSYYATGVRECYVTGSLAANIEDLKRLRQTMRIRMIPNLVQTDAYYLGNPAGIDVYKCFWLRPEAMSLYEGVVSTFEFVTDTDHNEEGLFSVYAGGKWDRNVGDFIIDPTGTLSELENRYSPIIDESRSKCGLVCQKDNSCHICSHIAIQVDLTRETEKN